jgi:hypothetical protein
MTAETIPLLFVQALEELCKAYQNNTFIPVLEADIAGYLYYVLVKKSAGDSSRIHLSGRISTSEGKRKYPDLVIGDVWNISQQMRSYGELVQSDNLKISMLKSEALKMVQSKGFRERLKPFTATIEVAVEIKPFLKGFSSQQLWHRLKNAREDLEALAIRVSAKVRMLLTFDDVGYLMRPSPKTRLNQLIELRDSLDPGIRIVYIDGYSSDVCNWKLF